MRNTKETLMHSWYQEAWNKANKDAIDKFLAPDIIAHGLAEGELRGSEGFKNFYDGFRTQFSNIHVNVDDVIKEDDIECALCTVTAIHNETGKAVKFTGTSMGRIKDGQIVEAWNNFDFYGMYLQLGYELSIK
ncbi:MAG: ester cyclase [Ferruginibacter sp.]